MQDVNAQIAMLIKTANGAKAPPQVVKALLEEAVSSIRAMRDEIERWPSPNVKDAVFGLEEVAATIEDGTLDQPTIAATLIDAADMLRDLHIVLDSGTEIEVKETIPLEPPSNRYPA